MKITNEHPGILSWLYLHNCCMYIELQTGVQIIVFFQLFYAVVISVDGFREFDAANKNVSTLTYVGAAKVGLAVLSSILAIAGVQKKNVFCLRFSAFFMALIIVLVLVVIFGILEYEMSIKMILVIFNVSVYTYFALVLVSYVEEVRFGKKKGGSSKDNQMELGDCSPPLKTVPEDSPELAPTESSF